MFQSIRDSRPASACRTGATETSACSVPEVVRIRLAELGRVVEFPADHVFWEEDHRPRFVAIVLQGFLRMVRYTVNGRRQIMLIVPPGELVGEGLETRAGYRLEAATPVQLHRMDRASFQRLVEEVPDLSRCVYRQCVDRLDRLQRMTWSLGMQSPEERLCALLVEARKSMPFRPTGAGGILTMELPRADIADYLGTTRETISRLTHKLQAAGLIRIHGSRTFEIPDFDRLARAAMSEPRRLSHPGHRSAIHGGATQPV